MDWFCKNFNTLSSYEIYEILRLRSEVFVVEQQCVFLDMDRKDFDCWHFWAADESGRFLAYTRLVPAGVSYTEMSIGRVVSSPASRGLGLGQNLMQKSIEQIRNMWGEKPIKIGAQFYLKSFYESFGFVQTSDIYLEDDIEHIEMILA
jgi:ElaA protein